jgi:BMFP domain-containing protein YqiC
MSKKNAIQIEEHDQKVFDDAVAGIKNIAKEAWVAALATRGFKKIELVDREFETWWKSKLEYAKSNQG